MLQAKLYAYEQDHWSKNLLICGMDEVGRGCLAGPIVTAATILHKNVFHPLLIDSKKLSPQNLTKAYNWLINNCTYSIAINSHTIIDQHNIYKTTQITMKQSLLHLLIKSPKFPAVILVDAMPLTLIHTPYQDIPITSLTQGESKSASIAAASIIAKITRDAIVTRLDASFPSYQFAQHKGYATKAHQSALKHFRPSTIHRQTFLKKFLTKHEHAQQSIFF